VGVAKDMKTEERIRQSEVRVKSGLRLIGLLLLLCVALFVFKFYPVVKIFLCITAFFAVVTAIEYWNAWRLKKNL
jgi:hypothetical protein